MRDPDLDAWIEQNYPSTSMDAVNAMLSPEEQRAIVAAAQAAHRGDDYDAEKFRKEAGYGGL